MALPPYGDVTIEKLDDGRMQVTRAGEVIGVYAELLAQAELSALFYADPAGNLVICGQLGYAPIGFAPDATGAARIIVCRRVWGNVVD